MTRPLHVLVVVLHLWGCAGGQSRPADVSAGRDVPRVAVLPSTWETASPFDVDAARALSEGLRGSHGIRTADSEAVLRRARAAPEGCAADVACARRLGRDLGVDRVVSIRLAALGGTVAVRVRLLDVSGNTAEQTVQEVVRDASAQGLTAVLHRLGDELGRPTAPRPSPGLAWYEHWWVWTLVGAAAIGTGAAIYVTVDQEPGPQPDVIITPP